MSINKLLKVLEKTRYGQLDLTTPDKRHYRFSGDKPGAIAHIDIRNVAMIAESYNYGSLGLARSYKNGLWESEDLSALLQFGLQNQQSLGLGALNNPLKLLPWRLYYFLRRNSISGSRRNIVSHYDLGNDFYSLWLDESMTYSSGIFHTPQDSIEAAQINKYDRILQKLGKHRQNVLEIGCGWGGFADRLLATTDHNISGITLSDEQYRYAEARLRDYRDRADIKLKDYRKVEGKYDSIVSIEMFEAVGEKYWSVYFNKIADALATHGKAMMQVIVIDDAVFEEYRKNADMIRSYIFPGGMLPSVKKFYQKAEESGLQITDCLSFGDSYVLTLQRWLKRFDDNEKLIRNNSAIAHYGDPFIRLWRFYLHFCIAGFGGRRTDVMQVELTHA